MERVIGMDVGPFCLAFELTDVRQILEMGGPGAELDPRALGVAPISLAEALGQPKTTEHPALLLLDGTMGPQLCSVCRLRGILPEALRVPFPDAAALKWPGLIKRAITTDAHDDVFFVLDKVVLMEVLQTHLDRTDALETTSGYADVPLVDESPTATHDDDFDESEFGDDAFHHPHPTTTEVAAIDAAIVDDDDDGGGS